MHYFCLYNEHLHQTDNPMQIEEKDTVKDHIKNWKNSTDLYWEWMKDRYQLEATNRGNGWTLWSEPEPFDWEKLPPEPAHTPPVPPEDNGTDEPDADGGTDEG